ncbi:uncharacterized protein LOC129599995 [Paramacrobiotus metropolitanus]|uniref:uncharacterized protein LOC129599995 n=1 Tax=Paramacrobiotus metropolitanus TaxID=2943436 RepID=UPI0024460C9D|nr:uncharacterized protein LOC129599995 [Paramacrobiotus metropolitanus]
MPVNGSGDSSVVPSLPVNFSQASHWLNTMVHPHPGATAEAWRSLVPHSGTYTHAQINRAYSFYIVSYFLLLFLCSLGNTLILAVIGRSLRQWQTSASRYMLVTALADLGALWLGFPVMLWNFGAVFDRAYHKLPRVKQVINAVKPLTGWGQEACMFTSDWLLVMFSLERLLIIISPFRLLQRIFLYHHNYDRCITTHCRIFKYDLYKARAKRPAWLRHWEQVQNPAEVVVSLLVFFVILTINVALIVFLARHRRSKLAQMRVKQIANKPPISPAASLQSGKRGPRAAARNSDIILISGAALYLLTKTPSVVFHCLMRADYHQQFDFDPTAQQLAAPFVNVPMYMLYSFRFFVYILTNAQFRERFMQLIVRPLWPHANGFVRREDTREGLGARLVHRFTEGRSTSAAAAIAAAAKQ